MSNPAVEEVQI